MRAFRARLAPGPGNEHGFTLLEGLVAIALLAGTMTAIFALVGSLLSSANKIGQANQAAQATLNAIEAMTTVNPMLEKSGQIDLGEYIVKWTSVARTPVVDGVNYPLGPSLYQLAFYNTDVSVERAQGEILATFSLRQVGYRRLREPPSPLRDLPGVVQRAR